MKLELSAKEVEKIVLEWANAKFPSLFNATEWGGYREPSSLTLEWSDTKKVGE